MQKPVENQSLGIPKSAQVKIATMFLR